jgi:hypothetical protein
MDSRIHEHRFSGLLHHLSGGHLASGRGKLHIASPNRLSRGSDGGHRGDGGVSVFR